MIRELVRYSYPPRSSLIVVKDTTGRNRSMEIETEDTIRAGITGERRQTDHD
jgi:hypothetical protein